MLGDVLADFGRNSFEQNHLGTGILHGQGVFHHQLGSFGRAALGFVPAQLARRLWGQTDMAHHHDSGQLGGHKAQGRTAETAQLVVEDALAVQAAGAQMILLEAIPPEVGRYITANLDIPVLSIGAGPHCDGQLLIVSDTIGQFQAFTPKFVKKYCDVAAMVTDAMKEYAADVRDGRFPEDEHCYKMIAGEEEKFLKLVT